MEKITTENFELPLFDAIVSFFDTFRLLEFSLKDAVCNYVYKPEKRIYSEGFENEGLFKINANTIKRQLCVELYYNQCKSEIIKSLIIEEYNKSMADLKYFWEEWDFLPDYKKFHFPIQDSYYNIQSPVSKQIFFHNLKFDNDNRQTVEDCYNAIIQELNTDYNEIMTLFTDISTPNASTPENTEIKKTKQLHFTKSFTDNERKSLFNGLVSYDFIPKDTDYNNFAFVFGGAETAAFEPLLWLKDTQDLKIFIDTFFTNEKSKWKKTISCFMDNQGKEINYNSIRNLNPKYKDNPSSETYFKNLKQKLER